MSYCSSIVFLNFMKRVTPEEMARKKTNSTVRKKGKIKPSRLVESK